MIDTPNDIPFALKKAAISLLVGRKKQSNKNDPFYHIIVVSKATLEESHPNVYKHWHITTQA